MSEIEVTCPVCSHRFYEWPQPKPQRDDTALLLDALVAMNALRYVETKEDADRATNLINDVMERIKVRVKGH
jgi:hypothetical protein